MQRILNTVWLLLAALLVVSATALGQYSQAAFDLKQASDLYDTRGYASGKGISVDGKLVVSTANGSVSYSYPISSSQIGGHQIDVTLNYCGAVSFTIFGKYQQANHPGMDMPGAGGLYSGWEKFEQNRPAYIISVNGFAVNVLASAAAFHCDSASRVFNSLATTFDDRDIVSVAEGYDYSNRMYDWGAVGADPNGGLHYVDEISILRADGSLLRLMNIHGTTTTDPDERPELYTGYYFANEANDRGFGVVEYDSTYWTDSLRACTLVKDSIIHYDTIHIPPYGRDSLVPTDTARFIRSLNAGQEWPLMPRKLHYYSGDGLEYVFREVRAPYGMGAYRDLVSRGGGYYGGPTIFYLEDIRSSAGVLTTFTRARHYPIFGNPLFEHREDTTRGRALITSFAGHQLSFDYNALIIEGLGRTTRVVFDTIARSGNAGPSETMPYANNGGLTPASLALAQLGETNPALYKSFVGYVTKIVDPEGRVTTFDYEPVRRTYRNMGFPRAPYGPENIDLTLKGYRLKSVTEPTARYTLAYYGATADTITSATETASDGPKRMNDVVDSVLKTDLQGRPLTSTSYLFQYNPNLGNFTDQSTVIARDAVTGQSTTTTYDYRQDQLPNLAPLLPPARYTELYRVSTVAADMTTVTETTTTTSRDSLVMNGFGTSYPINASSLPTPYLILPATSITTINGVVKSRTNYSYTLDTVRSYGGDKNLAGLFGFEVSTSVTTVLKPDNPSAVLLRDTTVYLHLPYADTVMSWTEHLWDKLASLQAFLHYRNDLHDPRMMNDPRNPARDQKLWEYWMMRSPVAQFTDVEKTELVHVPPLVGLVRYSSTSDNSGVLAGKINSYRTALRSGSDRFLRGELQSDTILGRGALRLPGSTYEWDGGLMTGQTNALGARSVYGYDYVFTNYTNVGLPIYTSEQPTGTILSNDSSTYSVTLQTTAYERLYGTPGAERHYVRRFATDTLGVFRTDSLTTYAEHGFYGQPTGAVDANGWYSRYEYDRLGRLTTLWQPGDFAHQGQLDTVSYHGAEVLDLYGYTADNFRADDLHCSRDEVGKVTSTIVPGTVTTTVQEDTLYASHPLTEYPVCPCKDLPPVTKGGDREILANCDYYYPFKERGGYDGLYSVLTYPVDSTSPLRTATAIDSASLDLMITSIDGTCAELEVRIPGTSFLKTYLLRCSNGDGGGTEPPKDRTKRQRPEIQSDHVTQVAGGYLLHVDLSGVAGALKTIAGDEVHVELRTKTVGATLTFANGLNGSDVRPRITIYGQYKRLWDGADYTLAYTHDDAGLTSEIAAKVDDIRHTASFYDTAAMHGQNVRRTTVRSYFGADYRLLKSTDSIFNASGFVRIDSTHTAYDGLGTALTAWNLEGDSVKTLYDAAGRMLRTTNTDGTRDSMVYEISSTPPSTQDFYGVVTKTIAVDERGVRHAQYRDAFDRVRYEVADVDGIAAVMKYEYDLLGRVTQVENPKHQITSYTYDDFGRIKAKQMPDIGMVSYAYDKLGNVRFSQNAEQARHNALTFTEYDDLNRPTLIGEAVLNRSEGSCPPYYEDSLYWECTPPTDALANRLTERLDPNLLHLSNDDNTIITANPTMATFPTDANDTATMFVKGPLMQGFISNCALPKSILLGETATPTGPSVMHWTVPYQRFTPPADSGDFEDMTLCSRFARIGIAYDKMPVMGRSVWRTFPPQATWDALAPTGAVRNQKGHEAAVAYRDRGSEPWHYNVLSYDERGRVEAILRATENLGFDAVYYTYNAMNKVTSVTVADPVRSYTTWYGYDREGHVDSVWTKLGAIGTGLVPPTGIPTPLQARKALTVVAKPAPLTRAANQQADIVYSYTKSGQVAQMIYPPVNAYIDYAYNHRSWLDSIVAHTGAVLTTGNLLFKEALSYDPSGQIIQQRYQHGTAAEQKQTYGYDSLDRLTTWTQNGGVDTTRYVYDAVGNRATMSESFVSFPENYAVTGGTNQLASRTRHHTLYGDTVINYRYDRNGAMSYRELTIDSSQGSWPGRTPKPSKIGLRFKEEDRYSYRGLLNRVFRTDSTNLASDWRYRYGASGEREQKRMVYTAAWDSVLHYPWVYYALGGSTEQLAVYHGQQTSAAGMCGDSGRRVYMYPTEYLTHGIGYTGTHEDIAQVITDPSGGKQFRISDHLASVRTEIGPAGAAQYDYDPWGGALPVVMPTPPRRGYNDREKDRETGSYNLGVREMDARVGFQSVDPLWQQSPSQSPYIYANANPLRLTDPKGMQAWEIFQAAMKGFFIDGPVGLIKSVPQQGLFMICPAYFYGRQLYDALNPDTYKAMEANLRGLWDDKVRLAEFGGKVGFDLILFKKLSGIRAAVADAAAATESAAPSTALTKYYPENNGFVGATERKTLMPGEQMDRLGGSPYSRFFSPVGTPEAARALPPGTAGQPLRTFEILKPLEVESGTVAPWFGQPGGGTQYVTPLRLEVLINRGIIKEITP
jgi:RHS repeat-associated protein